MPQDKEINENIIKYLSKNYIEKNNITSDNLNNYIRLLNNNQRIDIIDIGIINGKNTYTYATHGIATNIDYELTEEFYLYVILDLNKKLS